MPAHRCSQTAGPWGHLVVRVQSWVAVCDGMAEEEAQVRKKEQ